MYGRSGLDRFKKAQSLEPFSVTANSAASTANHSSSKVPNHSSGQYTQSQAYDKPYQFQNQPHVSQRVVAPEAAPLVGQPLQVTQVGGGQSTWQPPDWAIEPRPGVHYLEVLKDGEVLDRINLDKRKHIFGRQIQTCDFVLDHQSVSRQHAAVVPHKNGSVYVIDLGSAHGTFVANERLTKDTPVELEVGQSLRFAASTRSYILRKNNAALFPPTPLPTDISLPPPPDPSDEDAVVAYNTLINRYGLGKSNRAAQSSVSRSSSSDGKDRDQSERAAKKARNVRVAFRDQAGGELVDVVGISDGVDVETEPGPIGVKEGSLVGKYESLVQTVIIPKGKGQSSTKEDNAQKGVTDRLKQALDKVRKPQKVGMYDDLYGESFSGKVGSSWANSSSSSNVPASTTKDHQEKPVSASSDSSHLDDENDEDLFGD
ncbi:FHA domain-containing protein [Psidium guajava]|nr:FHA domain-containing protein [Psidium guajava]